MNRRGFLSVFTLGAVGTAASANVALVEQKLTESNVEQDGPISRATKLTISSPIEEAQPSEKIAVDGKFYSFSTSHDNTTTKTVSMSVGKDGNLWIETERGNWKKVVTE